LSAIEAIIYSFLFGLLHGILPDEHTWPITFSYAVGSGSGREGMRAGFYFSAAFTIQRMLISELAYFALARFLARPVVNAIVFVVVGIAMAAAGIVVKRRNYYPHVHVFGQQTELRERTDPHYLAEARERQIVETPVSAPPVRWALFHGFVAGFGFGAFSLFINTVAAPAMPNPWMGFFPGLCFGLGTMIMLVVIGAFFGRSLSWFSHSMTKKEIQRITASTGRRTLFFGGLLFVAFGSVSLLGLAHRLSVDKEYVLITAFMVLIVSPVLVYSVLEVRSMKKRV
jgi:sulfite exporter TauE/SafE